MAQFAPNDNMAEQALATRPQQDIELQPIPSPAPPQPSPETLPPADGNGQATKPPSEVNELALAEEFKNTRYKNPNDYNSYPDGWPRLAAEQDCRLNGGFFPRMGYLGNRVLLYQAGRINQLEQQIHKIDKEEEGHLRDLTEYQKRAAGPADNSIPTAPYDILMEEATKTWERWASLLILNRQVRALPPAPTSEVTNSLLSMMKPQIGLSSEAMSFVADPDDLVCTQVDREILPPDWVLQSGFIRFFAKHFAPKVPGTNEHAFQRKTIENVMKGLVVVAVPLALLVPFAMLYFPNLSKGASFGITVGATMVFNFIVVLFVSKLSLLTLLGSSCALLAIMATVAVQLQSGMPTATINVVGNATASVA